MQVKEAEGLSVSGAADLVLGEDRLALHAPDTGHCYLYSLFVSQCPSCGVSTDIYVYAQQLLCGVNGSVYTANGTVLCVTVCSPVHKCLVLTKHSYSLCSGGCDLSSSHRPIAGILAHCCSEALWSQQCQSYYSYWKV